MTATSTEAEESRWWRGFAIPELDALVDGALKANRNLHIAAARVTQARALVDAAAADHLPQLGLEAATSRGRTSGADPKATVSYGGLRASWEVDLFARKGFANNAAARDAEGAGLALRAMQVAVAADVCTTYFEARMLSEREKISRTAVETLMRQVEVARRRFDAGQSSSLEIDRLTAELRLEKAQAEQLHGAYHTRLQQLAVLAGESSPRPLAFSPTVAGNTAIPAVPLPATLLERRPDVQRQARAVEAALARLGVAKSDVYPRIQFDWADRNERLSPSGATTATTIVIGYGFSVSLPIFDGGRIRANIALREGQAEEAMADYEKAMLVALADARGALEQQAALAVGVEDLDRAAVAAAAASLRSQRLFDAGTMDLSAVLDTHRGELRAQDALCQARAAQSIASVAVYRAFAGTV